MKTNFFKTGIVIAFSVVLLIFLSHTSFASSPSYTFLNADKGTNSRILFEDVAPGETVYGNLVLSLFDDVPTIFSILFKDSMSYKLSKIDISEEDKKFYEYSSWVALDVQSPIFLEKLGKIQIPYHISVPEGALPGDYTGIFLASIHAFGDKAISLKNDLSYEPSMSGSGTKVKIGLGLEFLLRVKGEIFPSLEFLDVSYFKEAVSDKFNLVLSYENKGNVVVIPRANVSIKNIWGRDIFQGEYNFSVLAPFDVGTSNVKLSTKDFYFDYGIYDVDVDLFYDVFSRELGDNMVYVAGKANVRIIYLPWYLFAGIILIIMIVLIIVFYKNIKIYLLSKNVKNYVVKQNDTLQSVSVKYRVNPKTLVLLNKIKSPFFINPGDILLIPLKKDKNEKKQIKKV